MLWSWRFGGRRNERRKRLAGGGGGQTTSTQASSGWRGQNDPNSDTTLVIGGFKRNTPADIAERIAWRSLMLVMLARRAVGKGEGTGGAAAGDGASSSASGRSGATTSYPLYHVTSVAHARATAVTARTIVNEASGVSGRTTTCDGVQHKAWVNFRKAKEERERKRVAWQRWHEQFEDAS